MNPYHVLGVCPDASLETIKVAYRRLAREHHPDSAQDEVAREHATRRMSDINAAWQVLGDPAQRAALDARLFLDKQEREAKSFRERGINPAQPPSPVPRHAHARRAKPARTPRSVGKARGGAKRASAAAASSEGSRSRRKPPRTARPVKLSSQAKLAEAKRMQEQGRAETAIALCLSVLRTDFRSVPARELLSEIYMAQGQPHRAFALLEQALVLQPTNATLVRKLNQLSSRSGTLNPTTPRPRPVSVPEAAPPRNSPASPLAMSVKHSVLGQLCAFLLRLMGGGK